MDAASGPERPLRLRLYVSGNAPNSLAAIRNLRALGERRVLGTLEVEIVDILKEGHRAVRDRVVVTPTLMVVDAPHIRVLGNLSDTERVLARLDGS